MRRKGRFETNAPLDEATNKCARGVDDDDDDNLNLSFTINHESLSGILFI